MLTRWFVSLIAGVIVCLVLTRYVMVYGPFDGMSVAASLLSCFDAGGFVFVLLQALFVVPVFYVERLVRQADQSTRMEAKALVKTDNAGWERTTVAHLEDLKYGLNNTTKQLNKVAIAEVEVGKLRSKGVVKRWLGKQGLRFLRKESAGASARLSELRYQIERIYRGEVDPEIADYREEITQLRLEQEPVDKDSFFAEFVIERNKKRDARIRRCERNIAELEQWRKKASATLAVASVAESPNEIAWRNFVDTAKRTASVPIIQASSRIEAAMAGLEARRYYDKIVVEQLHKGTITKDEAAFIRRRIEEEFLGGTSSIYT